MQVPKLEKAIGIEVYATASSGTGGVIREKPEDFIVEEVLVDGSRALADGVKSDASRQVLGASQVRNRYLLCVLVKRNWDTLIAVRNIARQLGIDSGQVQFAGIKDAKAITAQHVTIGDVSAEDLKKIHVKDIEIRPVGYVPNRLSAYYLFGNSFHIAIRSMNHRETTVRTRIAAALGELNAVGGAPNFFGHQRFGTIRPITHAVGKAIIKNNLQKAATIFLALPSPHEHPSSKQARKELRDTQNYKRALQNFPKQLRYERIMLQHLTQRPDDYTGAFRRLPIKLRELFVQGYQSYLFNRFLSKRVESGLSLCKAEVGDYVVNVERSGLPSTTMYRTVSTAADTEINDKIKKGSMRLAIPLVGLRRHLSQGIQGEMENRILESERVFPKDFKVTALPEIREKGRLRTAVTPLIDFSLEETARAPSGINTKIAFTLQRGSYATIILREIMKPKNIIKQGF